MRIWLTFIFLIFSFLLFNSCQNDPEHEPSIQGLSHNPQEKNSLAEFERNIKAAVLPDSAGDDLQNSIYEGLGTIFIDAFVAFETKHGENIGFIPVFREDSEHTEAVIIASLRDDIPHYAFLERGQLYPYELWNSFIKGFPTVNVMADLFISFDRNIFQSTNSSVRDIIGSAATAQLNEAPVDFNVNNSNVTDVISEWEGTEICLFTFTGTTENPYENLTNIDCFTEWTWESVPSNPEILDSTPGGSGGGGGGGSTMRNCSGVISCFPYVKYPTGSNYATQYPKLTEYLKNQLPKISNNQKILDAIKKYTNMTEAQIKKQLKWGDGPEIKIGQYGSVYGKFNATTPNTLYLDIDYVNGLENSTPGATGDAFAFIIGVTVLHELVHYGEWNYNGKKFNSVEQGNLFEKDAYGGVVTIKNGVIYYSK